MLFAHHDFWCRITGCVGCVGSTEGLQIICCERLSDSLLRGPDKPNLHLPWEGCMRQVCFMLGPNQVAMRPRRHRQTQSYADREGFAVVDCFCCVFANWVEYTLGKFDGLVLSPHKISPNWCWGYSLLAWIVCLLGEKPLWPRLDQHC